MRKFTKRFLSRNKWSLQHVTVSYKNNLIYSLLFFICKHIFFSSVVNHDLLCLILLNKFINFPKSIFFSSPTAALIKLSKSASLVTSPLAFFTVFSTSHAFSNSPSSLLPDLSFSNASKSSGALLKRGVKIFEKNKYKIIINTLHAKMLKILFKHRSRNGSHFLFDGQEYNN